MSVRKEHFDDYIRTFLSSFIELSRVVDSEIREVAFPKFLLVPYKINCVISNTHGLSIEFLEESANYQISIVKVNISIEEAILPQKNSKTPCFEISTNRFIDITGMVVVSQDFRDKYVTEMISGITYINPVDGFLHIAPGGDVKFHNSQFGAIVAGEPKYVKTGDCLWIYGSNKEEDFTIEMAKSRAFEEFNVDLATLIHSKYDISAIDGQRKTIEVFNNKIQELERKIREDATEPQLQDFFKENPEFLFFGNKYSKIYPHVVLERENKPDLIPDFLLKRVTDGYCDILDIKLPDKNVVVGANSRRKFSSNVESAIAQADDYREFFDDPRNREKIENKHGIKIYKPRKLVLIGGIEQIDNEELIRIRDRLTDGEVLTYDDLIKQMKALIDLIKPRA